MLTSFPRRWCAHLRARRLGHLYDSEDRPVITVNHAGAPHRLPGPIDDVEDYRADGTQSWGGTMELSNLMNLAERLLVETFNGMP